MRAELPVLERLAYLNTGTFGPLPRRTVDEAVRWQQRVLVEGRSSLTLWEETKELRTALREALARLIGAQAGALALTTSTTEGCDIVVSGLRLGPEDEVVTTDCEHPGLLGALHVSPAGVRVARIRDRPASEALAAIEAELNDRTRLVAISHVAWTTGAVLPVAKLSGRRFPVLVDGAQSVGTIPVDVGELGCDFYTVSGQKWLLGPDTTGALYVGPDWIHDLSLTAPSYLSWEDTVELVPWPDARRFESIWIGPGPLAGLLASLRFAEEVGGERFQQASDAAEACRSLCAESAEVVTEHGQATIVTFRPSGDPAELVASLAEQGVVVRDLPGLGWVRVSCGYWTNGEDLERLAAGL
ncbi:MAG TPA: aminotransferase class V-fold PLP-dependent enzyme [Gaiellaceae bacterium]|nr:aminotransferase class V-fold PLP-dependent enzyme [Gaiellaceae bacterium]